MRLSTRARYAVRLMLDISKQNGTEQPVRLNDVARRSGVSRGYLEQLTLSLKSAGLLKGIAGRHGGYMLTRQPQQIRIGEIIEASIGPIYLADCLGDPATCLRSDFCECHLLWGLLNARIRDVLYDFSLADLGSGQQLDQIREQTEQLLAPETATERKPVPEG